MSDLPPYPPIDPTTFDLIVVGTGLTESLIAAAASSIGKTVLHLDPNHFYGSHFASLSLPDFTSFLHSTTTTTTRTDAAVTAGAKYSAVNLSSQPMYSDVEISSLAPDILEKHSRKFSLDLAGPRVLLCADKSIDLLLKSHANNYVEFKTVDFSFVGGEDGKLHGVPDSRAAIFKDKGLSLAEKRQLMSFFKLVQKHLAGETSNEDYAEEDSKKRISEEDLETPFVDFLTKMQLPPKIKSIILYAIAMANYDQENKGDCKDLLKTEDGIARLAIYQSSLGRFTNASAALIYPLYGQGEIPQAFCRRAAVKGCIYVLRMPVVAVLMDQNHGTFKGVRLASGQEIFSQKLVLDPSYNITSLLNPLPDTFRLLSIRDIRGKVARGVCIIKGSLKPETSNFLVTYPPRSLCPEQVMTIRALQVGSNLAVCPSSMSILYLSALCDDAILGKNMLNAAIRSLLRSTDSGTPESGSSDQTETPKEEGPSLLWSSLYMQELTVGHFGDSISCPPMPDGCLNYGDQLDTALQLLQRMYPDEEYFLETTKSADNSDDDTEPNPEA